MERNKIKMKYLLGVWKHLPGYPSKEDVIYEINSFLLKEGKFNGEFSSQNLISIFGKKWEESKHFKIFNESIESKDIEISEKSNETKKWYKIKKQ